ncbi:hypothetical protein DEU56DRAFT_927512 [Suillus clintonianus]|uniref:uncharacterized protein n=1 Tax=Suillus clintonianus TaxID=1904413 RepID=UPI001B87C5BA|nr:uncharacterized protein DEU56DRAFT_927512 [Suillus clintonianus]KAG2121316.1 hypothetical protein DEU56DRAFT_927512 [Suillus clintonianus]
MSNLPQPPPSSTEKLTARKVFRAIGVGIIVLASLINSICIAAIFIYIGFTIPALRPYAGYVGFYTLGARTITLLGVFSIGCYWCCLRLVAPKQAGSSLKEWRLKFEKTLCPSDGKLSKAARRYFGELFTLNQTSDCADVLSIPVAMGILNTFSGLRSVFYSWKEPEFSRYQFVMGVILLFCGAQSSYIAYVGRVPRKKGTGGKNMTVGNNVSQPKYSDEVTPAGEYTTTQ